MCSIWQSFLDFSWIIIHEDIPGMSLLLWKMQSKVSSAYSIVGINALHVKEVLKVVTYMSLPENMGILQKSPLALMELRDLPSCPAGEFRFFLSLPISLCLPIWKKNLPVVHPMLCQRWVQSPEWSTHLNGAEIEPGLSPGCSCRCPQDTSVRAVLCSSGDVVFHSSPQLQISWDMFSLHRHIRKWSRTCYKHGQGHWRSQL